MYCSCNDRHLRGLNLFDAGESELLSRFIQTLGTVLHAAENSAGICRMTAAFLEFVMLPALRSIPEPYETILSNE